MASTPFLNGFGSKAIEKANGNTLDHMNGSIAEFETELSELYKRYEHFGHYDAEKNKFTKELLMRVELLIQQQDRLKAERNRDYEFVNSWQSEKLQYEKYFKTMQRALAENPFVVVLIDGDGMIFTDDFIRQGEAGGRRAASQLYGAMQEYVDTEAMDVPLGTRIVCRMYANVRGLSDVLVRKGIIDDASLFEDFVRGFTRGKTLFDFVDVGNGKDRADEKIIESFKMFSQDLHCRRLLFGCSHDNGYARALEQCSDRPEVVSKVVLLEGVPFEKELVPLPYRTKKFPGLFRETKIVLNPGAPNYLYNLPTAAADLPSNGPKTYNMLSGLPSRFPPPPTRPPGFMDSPLPSRAALAASINLPRTPSTSTLASDSFPAPKPTISWASKAAGPPPPVTETPVYKPAVRDELIARNRAGQRVDPPCKDYDKAEVDRVKKMKLCNVHFLRNECSYDTNCTHLHKHKPTMDELSTLRLVARMAPCVNGSGCQDIRCIYGHRCPAPPHRTHPVKGTKSCIFGESCKFPPELHDIDTNVVKTLVIK